MFLIIFAVFLVILGAVLRSTRDEVLTVCGSWLYGFAVVLVVIASSVSCASSRTGKALEMGVIGAKVADQISTDRAEARGAIEQNPLLGSQQWRQVVFGVVGVSTVIALAHVVEHRSPKVAHLLRVIPMIVWSSAAVWNGRQGR